MNFGKTRSSNTALRNFWVAESNNTSRRKVRSTCESHPRETPWLCCHRCDSGFVDVGVQGRVRSSGAFSIKILLEKLLEKATSGYTPRSDLDLIFLWAPSDGTPSDDAVRGLPWSAGCPPFSGEYTFKFFLQESGQNLRRNSGILAL